MQLAFPFVRFVPGWRRLVLIGAPVVTAIALLVAAYAYTHSATLAAAPAPITDPVRLPRGDRVYDAIAAAGGFSRDADMSRVPNLAGRLRDGEQIKVPFAKSASGTLAVRVNLNQATLEELESIPGFTAAFAREVMDYRTSFGGFQSTRELVDILGMSEAAYVVVRRYVTL